MTNTSVNLKDETDKNQNTSTNSVLGETVLFEKITIKEGISGIAIIRVNRPKALNALNSNVIKELGNALDLVKRDSEIRCVILTGAGEKAFVAGADIKEMEHHSPGDARTMSVRGQRLFQRIESFPIPIVAAVNGFALGGGMELALACDFIIASQKAKFGLPEVSLGVIPGYGGTQRLSRVVGKSLARFVALTGDIYSADHVQSWGLVAEVQPHDQLMDRVLEVARIIAKRAPRAVSLAKQSINEGFDRLQDQGMILEAELFAETFTTKDRLEGINAFIAKREPDFRGH